MSLLAKIEIAAAKMRRKRISKKLFEDAQGVVQDGIFKGMVLSQDTNISQSVLGLKIHGLFEAGVVALIEANAPFSDVIDIGAADGYYPVGMLKAGLAKRAICFEMTDKGRVSIAENAKSNGVEDKIEIFGVADESFDEKLASINFNAQGSLFICDIEGSEFTVLTSDVLEAINGALMIIELHDFPDAPSSPERDALISRMPENYVCEVITAPVADWTGIVQLERLHDIDRALVTSDGRKRLGEWLVCRPKS